MNNLKEQELLRQLSTEEKLQLTTGNGAWHTAEISHANVLSVAFSDGPLGLRKEQNGETVPAVCFPSISKLACSFDPDVLREVGTAIGNQCLQENVRVLLAPGINVKRDPRCGRNFEYFSEDPLLTAELACAYVKGVHSREVGVCVKHFAANSQEYGRRVCDSVVDERALREIYLSAFERVVKKAKPCAVMCAYNKLNGEYCSQNQRLLTDILRNEWGFDGAVISDWGATDDRAKGIAAGLDLQMPQGDLQPVKDALENGSLSLEQLDVAAGRVARLAGSFGTPCSRKCDFNFQHNLVRRISADCTVLAKNNCKLLPFAKTDKVALIGALAEKPYFQGDGSSKVNPYRVETLKQVFEQSEVQFVYAAGYSTDGADDEALLEQAREAAALCEKVLLVVGNPCESEGFDRKDGQLPQNQLKVIDAVTSQNSNVAIAVQSGAPLDVSWHHGAKALILDYLCGENCGGLFDVVFGDVNPTGRLAETWPLNLPKFAEEYGQNYKRALYRESIFVGYRYYETAGVEVAFPFGYGLNYNVIRWSNVQLSNESVLPVGKLNVSVTLENCGETDDAETVQIYVTNLDGRDFYAKKNLVAFKKVRLKGKEKKTVVIPVDVADFASYDVNKGEFYVNGGEYLLTVAKNAQESGCTLKVRVEGENSSCDNSEKYSCYYNVDENFCPTDEEFQALYGEFPQETTSPVTINSPLCEIGTSKLGKFIVKRWSKSPQSKTLLATPLVDFVWLRNDVSLPMLNTLVQMLNGEKHKLLVLLKQTLQHLKKRKRK